MDTKDNNELEGRLLIHGEPVYEEKRLPSFWELLEKSTDLKVRQHHLANCDTPIKRGIGFLDLTDNIYYWTGLVDIHRVFTSIDEETRDLLNTLEGRKQLFDFTPTAE